MIKAEFIGDGVHTEININGGFAEAIFEFSSIVKSFRKALSEEANEEFADQAIAYAGRMAVAKTTEDMEEYTEAFKTWMDEDAKSRGTSLGVM